MSDPNFDPMAMAMAQNALLDQVMQRLDDVTRYVDQTWRAAQPGAETREQSLRAQCLQVAIGVFSHPNRTPIPPKGEEITAMAREFLSYMKGELGPKAPVMHLLPGGKS